MKLRTLLFLTAALLPGACSLGFMVMFGGLIYSDMAPGTFLNLLGFLAVPFFGFIAYRSQMDPDHNPNQVLFYVAPAVAFGVIAGSLWILHSILFTNWTN